VVFLCKHDNRQRYKRIELEDLESKVKRRKTTNLDKEGLTIKARPLRQPPMHESAQSREAQELRPTAIWRFEIRLGPQNEISGRMPTTVLMMGTRQLHLR
jgi:hypothetical protein